MNEKEEKMWNALCSLSGEKVANILTDVHGLQILDDDVYEELVNLGILEDEDEDED